MEKSVRRIDMCHGPIFINVIKYTVPIICTSLLQLLFNAADLVVVGRFCGSNSVAAVGATNSLINLLVNFFIGLSIGVSVCVANAVGAKDEERIIKTIHTAVPLAVICGTIITVIGLTLSIPILKLMGTPSDIIPLSALYTRIYFCGMIPTVLFEFSAAVFRAFGDTKTPLKYLGLSGLINVVLNVFFVTVIKLDVAGVALATIISQTISCSLMVRSLVRRNDIFKLNLRKIHIYRKELMKIVRIGFPSGLQSSVFSLSNIIIQSSINSFGAVAVAGNAAASSVEGFVFVTIQAFQQTSLNYTAQNVGAKNQKRIKKAFYINLLCVTVFSIIIVGIIYIFKTSLISLYLTDSPAAIKVGVDRTSFMCMFYFMCGIFQVLNGSIRGMGFSFIPMIISLVGVCGVRILWIFTAFKSQHTLYILYLSYPISWAISIVALTVAFVIIYKITKVRLIALGKSLD